MFFNRQIPSFFALFFLCCNFAFAANSDWIKSDLDAAKTRLIASTYEENGNKKLIIGVEFNLQPGWKIYGNDAGGIGMPPSFNFDGSKNYLNHQITWPEAERHEEVIGDQIFNYSAYHQNVIIPIEINLEKIEDENEINLSLEYGVCKDVCIPVNSKFSLKVKDETDVKVLREIQKFYPNQLIQNQEKADPEVTSKSLFLYVLFAFLGGLILNVMPCVLPVLSIKLLSIINHPNAQIERVRFAFLATTLGILFCFVILSSLALTIKFTGNELGWGLQFQNTNFLIFLTLVVGFFTANLFGKFELSFEQFLANFLNKKINEGEKKKNVFLPNFLSGILATILATPCSAPFLGSAISFALTEDSSTILLIFFFIGIGFSAPYILLFFRPSLVHFLPKPGMWMLSLKKLLGLLMLTTWFWLLFVLSKSLDLIGISLVIAIFFGILLCLKIPERTFKSIAILALVLSSFSLSQKFSKKSEVIVEKSDELWREFSEEEIYKQVKEGNVVLVDVTADWCITCKFNKANVLQSEEITLMLKRGDFIGFRGDITKPNPKIMEFLRKHNRFAIPFNAVYGPSAPEGLLTSELLNKKELIKLINQAQ